jgi:hypothetical protein
VASEVNLRRAGEVVRRIMQLGLMADTSSEAAREFVAIVEAAEHEMRRFAIERELVEASGGDTY